MVCAVLGRWDWSSEAAVAAVTDVGYHESLQRGTSGMQGAWFLYRGYEKTAGFIFGPDGGPSALCVVREDVFDCRGEVSGSGSVAPRGRDLRSLSWRFRSGKEQGAALHQVYDAGFNSFRGLYISDSERRTYFGFAQFFVLSTLGMQSAAVYEETACCTAPPVKMSPSKPCAAESSTEAAFSSPLGAPACVNRSLAPCTVALTCSQAGERTVNAKFRVVDFLTAMTQVFPPRRVGALSQMLEFVRAEFPAVWYLSFCIPCATMRHTTRYLFMIRTLIGTVTTAAERFAEVVLQKDTIRRLQWDFGNLVYASYIHHYLDTWQVVSH